MKTFFNFLFYCSKNKIKKATFVARKQVLGVHYEEEFKNAPNKSSKQQIY